MARSSKIVSYHARVARDTVVAHLKARIAVRYPNSPPTTAYQRIAKDTGHTLSTIQRVMSGGTGPSIDTLADIAHNLGVQLHELFVPRTSEKLHRRQG